MDKVEKEVGINGDGHLGRARTKSIGRRESWSHRRSEQRISRRTCNRVAGRVLLIRPIQRRRPRTPRKFFTQFYRVAQFH